MKKILATVVAFGVLAGAGVLFITRDTAATHPSLVASDLPKLIPTRAFFADPRAAWGYVASSDGKYVSFGKASVTGRSVAVKEVATDTVVAEFPAGLRAIRWHPTKPLIRFIYEGSDWEADPFQPEQENWTRISPARLSGGWNKSEFASSEEQDVLVWGKTSSADTGHMWLVSQDGLRAEKIAEGNPKTQFWSFNAQKEPILRVDSLDEATSRVFRQVDGAWEPLIDVSVNDTFLPVSWVQEDGTVLARSSRGRDKVALVSFDTATGEETVLIETPKSDISWHSTLTHDWTPDVQKLGWFDTERVALTDRGEAFLSILDSFPQPVFIGDLAPTASGRYLTAALSPQGKSFVYLLIDLEEATYEMLGEYHFRRFKDRLVSPQAVTFTARDGRSIPAILTMPQDVAGPIPFVVHIHGGPARHQVPDYDHDTQFLVNRGYGVLSVNFRGSTGFGKEFQAAGFKEFGRAMQDDIADAAHWLVAEGMADPDALIAMGMSYGGYAAAMAMTRDPGLFDAAIVEFPMLDIEYQTRNYPGFWENGIYGWWRYFGQVENEEELASMRAYSPSNRVAELHGPVMVLGGMQDRITSVEQVKAFEKAATEAGKDVQVHYFVDAGHGVQHWRDTLRRARLIEDFLAAEVGGRSGGFELVEWAPAFID